MSTAMIYITAGSRTEAAKIGRTIVEERLAACANVVPEITSYYWWEGAVQEDSEASLILQNPGGSGGESYKPRQGIA